MRKQSAADRQKRLDEGRCPIHGIGMGQIDSWYEETDWNKRRTLGRHYTLVHDGRQDCPLIAKAYGGPDGPHELLPEWQHVLSGESDDDLAPREKLAQPEPRIRVDSLDEWHDPARPMRYAVLIQWSDTDGAYHAALPEWEGRIANPVASAKTYSKAAYEAHFALRWLLETASREKWPLPIPLIAPASK